MEDQTTQSYLQELLVDNFDKIKEQFDESDQEMQTKILRAIEQEEFFVCGTMLEMHLNSMNDKELETFRTKVDMIWADKAWSV